MAYRARTRQIVLGTYFHSSKLCDTVASVGQAQTGITESKRGFAVDALRRHAVWAAPAGILLALSIAIFWKIALTDQFTWLNSPDLTEQVLPFIQEQASQAHHGHFPVWDPHHWGGQSLIGQDQPGVLFPLNWLLWIAPMWQGHVALRFTDWYFVLIHFVAALLCYFFARDLGLSSFASICAGVGFGLSGYMGNTDWPQMLNGGMWAPLVLLFAVRALNGRRPHWNMAVAGSIAGFSFFGGHHQLPTYTLLSIAFLLAFHVVFRGLRILSAAVHGATCILFTVLIGAPQLLPSYEYWSRAMRWVSSAQPVGFHDKVPYVVFDLYSFSPVGILGLIVPSTYPNVTPYLGITILSFAVLGVVTEWRSRMVPPLAVLAVGAFLFSLGKYSIFHGILYSLVPLLDKSRNAAFAMFIADLALAVLAGFGIDHFLRHRARIGSQLRIFGRVLFTAGGLVLLLVLACGVFEGEKMFTLGLFALMALSAFLLACLVVAWRLDRIPARGAMLWIAGLIVFETGMVTTSVYAHHERGWTFTDRLSAFGDLAEFLHKQPGVFRIFKNAQDITFNFGDWYGLDEFGGMGAGITTNIVPMNGPRNARALMGVTYYLSHEPRDSDPEPIFRGRSGVNVYHVPDAFPRAWTVHSIDSIESPSAAGPRIEGTLSEFVSKTFVVGPAPKLDTCNGADTVRPPNVGVTSVEVEADMACQGMLIVSNTFFPGWRAEVDGTSATVHEAYAFLQGVVVPAGHHKVRLHYVPATLFEGLGLAGAGMLGLLLLHRNVRHA